MIVQTLNESQFIDQIKQYWESLSYDGAKALYEYYDSTSNDEEEPFQFDGVAIRCDWSEHDTVSEAYREYDFESDDDPDDMDDEAKLDVLRENTTVIELDNGHVLVEAF